VKEVFLSRRTLLKQAALAAAALGIPAPLLAARRIDPDRTRLSDWVTRLRADGLAAVDVPFGRSAARVGELAAGTPYEAGTLDQYIKDGGKPSDVEPLALSLTHFDCVTLVESCIAVGRLAGQEDAPSWERFGQEVERMRYRGGKRRAYSSRLHYFSEWISDGEDRGLVQDLGLQLGAVNDLRPLRFMTEHRQSYPALSDSTVFSEIAAMERRLDGRPRRVVRLARIPAVVDQIETGDVLAFATGIDGLDVTHAAFAYRSRDGVLRVLHAPLSGGAVEVSRLTLPDYVAAIHRATGILVARPARG
jgi:N-acetylmuramoyl-L-alanine amidase-like